MDKALDNDSDESIAPMTAEAFKAVCVVKADPARAQLAAHEYHAAITAAIVESVSSNIALILRWAKKEYFLASKILRHARMSIWQASSICLTKTNVPFRDDAAETSLERSDDRWPAVERASPNKRTGIFSSEKMPRVFNKQAPPAAANFYEESYSAGWT